MTENIEQEQSGYIPVIGTPLELGEPVDLPGGLKGYPSYLVLLSGEEMYREDFGGRFVIDLDSVILGKKVFIGDFNHNRDEIIGHGTLEVTEQGLVGKVFVIPLKPDDRATEIVMRSKSGTPYEASPTIQDELAVVETVGEGKTAIACGREFTGPIRIYRNVPIRGWSVCPFGTDTKTRFTVLKMSGENMTKKLNIEEENQEQTEPIPTEATNDYTAVPELEKMIEAFGLEKGVDYFRRGISFDEAEKLDYAELKANRSKLSAEEDAEAQDPEPEMPENTEELEKANLQGKGKTLSTDPYLKELGATVKTLAAVVNRLVATSGGGEEPLSSGIPVSTPKVDESKLHAVDRMAQRLKGKIPN